MTFRFWGTFFVIHPSWRDSLFDVASTQMTQRKRKDRPSRRMQSLPPHPNLVDVPCKNLKLTEIIYKENDDIRHLIELFMRTSGNLPNNCIKFTKVV